MEKIKMCKWSFGTWYVCCVHSRYNPHISDWGCTTDQCKTPKEEAHECHVTKKGKILYKLEDVKERNQNEID
jgi:hypothetical protein